MMVSFCLRNERFSQRGLVYLLYDFYAHCSRTFIECDYLSLREHKEIIYQERKKKKGRRSRRKLFTARIRNSKENLL